ncbi:MAG: choice-of-anchor D domain-containing protein [Chlorobi bacterium]|nr:choice-of-anchor D domain-containing protein [Chlorobiota bacterium]
MTVDLTGVGSCIDVVFSSDEIQFGEVDTGKTAIASYVITNKPGSIQTLSGTISLSNNGNGQFKIISGGGGGTFQIPPGQSHTIEIEYRPDQCGDATGELVITHNATNEPSPKNIPIYGRGACRNMLVSPTAIDFGKIAKTDASPWQQVEISNDVGSNDTLNVTIPCTFTGADGSHFEIDPLDCGDAQLLPGESKTINLRFAPAEVGTFSASLDLNHDATTTIDSPFPIAVTGEGIPKVAVINVVSNLNFGDVRVGRDTTLNLNITNTGNGPLNIQAMGIDGSDIGDFSYFPTDTFTVWQGETQSIAMTFTPKDMGQRQAVFTIVSNDPLAPESNVALTGKGLMPKMQIAVQSLDFDTVAVTLDSIISFNITNAGNINLDIAGIRVSGADKSQFRVQPTGAFSVAPGNSHQVDVTFAPTSTGRKNARLEIQQYGGFPQNIDLTGFASAAPKPAISASSPSIDFGKTTVSTTATKSLVLHNSGTGTLEITTVKLIGTHPEMYSVTPTPPFSLQPGDSLALTISFSPTATGQLPAQLVISSNAGGDLSITLLGEGAAPALALSDASLDFGDVLVNSQKTLPVVITNQGTAVLTISSISVSTFTATDFSYTFALPHTIQAGESDSMWITFTPAVPGLQTATMIIASNTPGKTTDTISLRGIGIARAPVISLSTTVLDFGNVIVDSTITKSFTIKNTGNADLVVNGFTLSGSSNDFSIGESTPLSIAPTESKQINVSFSPRSDGAHGATLTITHNDTGTGSVDVQLSGFAVRPGKLRASVSSIDFGKHKDRDPRVQRSFVVTNSGNETLTIQSQVIEGQDSSYFRIMRSLPSTVQGGEHDTLFIAFLPHLPTGTKNATLRITYSGTNTGAIDVALKGEVTTDPTNADNTQPVFFELRQNYPNPFRTRTIISFDLPKNMTTRLTVHDVFGRLVATLVDEHQTAGEHSIRFNANGLTPGVYFYTLQVNGFSVTRKLLLTR